MRVVRYFRSVDENIRGAVVAVGNFDGVHMGHQAVIGEAGKIARALERQWAVLTFEPHPRSVFRPDDPPFRLTPTRAKIDAIRGLGVDALVVKRFDLAFSKCLAEDFVTRVLVESLGVRHLIAGYDFRFGHQRKGDCGMLLDMGRKYGFDFTVVREASDDGGGAYSSTRVRELIDSGDVRGAAEILGRPFAISDHVRRGDARGRTIGFPTANLLLGHHVVPRLGVYAVQAYLGDGTPPMTGVANIGRRPTFNGEGIVLEVHLLDVDLDLYGRRLDVHLIDFIRPEKKFDGIDALKAQIARDRDRARQILSDIIDQPTPQPVEPPP